jgi:hypothetical protein
MSSGRFACAVWAYPSKVPLISFPMGVVMRELNIPALPPGLPGPFALADIGILENALTKAGFKNVQIEQLTVIFRFDSVQDSISPRPQLHQSSLSWIKSQKLDKKKYGIRYQMKSSITMPIKATMP